MSIEVVDQLSLAAFAALVSLVVLPAPVRSQPPVQRIDGDPICGDCAVERYLVATIHDRDYASGAIGNRAAVHPTSSGRFFVTAGPAYNQLFLTDEEGSIVRQIGAIGQGPGEFTDARAVLETPSAFAVIDRRQGRLTTLDKESLEVIRAIRMPVVGPAANPVIFDDGTLVVSEWPRASAAGPLHVTGPDGELLRSFGSVHEGAFPQMLSRSGDAAFWATYVRGYRLERWSKEGELLQVLERAPEWWVANSDELVPGDQYNFVGQIHEDEAGLLWVHIHIHTKPGEAGGFFQQTEGKASVIEVIDPRRGEVLASTRFPGVAQIGQQGDGFYQMVIEETPTGLNLLRIWGNRLQRGGREP